MIISKYHNLDLEAFGYQKAADGSERFHVRVEAPMGVGGQKRDEAKEVTVPPDLRKRARQLERRRLKKSDMQKLGAELANLLFPTEETRRLLTRSWDAAPENEGLRVRLKLETYALADLPWEYIHLSFTPKGFVAYNRRISLVRYEVMEQDRPCPLTPVTSGALRVVILSANPYRDLDLTGEVQKIADALKREVQGINVIHHPDATLEKLLDALKQGAHVFHFAGHGRFEGDLGMAFGSQEGKVSIVLLGENRKEQLFSANTLKVKLADRGVRLVVLNACESGRRGQQDPLNEWTGIAPALIAAGIPAVLGMQYSIKDKHAMEFSKEFYSALALGYSIDAAVAEGRQAILMHTREGEAGWRDWGVPVLYLHQSGREGVLFPRPWKEEGPGKATKYTAPSGQKKTERKSIPPTPASLLQRDAEALNKYIELFRDVETARKEFPDLTPLIKQCRKSGSPSMVGAVLPSIESFTEKARACIDAVEDSKELLWSRHKKPLLEFVGKLDDLLGKIERCLDNPDTEKYTQPDTSAEFDECQEYCQQFVESVEKAIKGMQKPAKKIRDKLLGGMKHWADDMSKQVDKILGSTNKQEGQDQ